MSVLLELERVEKSVGGSMALADVSLDLEAGEMVVVLGERRSGRSTLLRVASGIETPDRGEVRFEGRDLTDCVRIGYCHGTFLPAAGPKVLDQLIAGQLARRVGQADARREAWLALRRVGAEELASLPIGQLKTAESVRVSIARALTCKPLLLVIDEPTLGVEMVQRDEILRLLRSLADEGVAVLASAGDGTGLLGADRVLTLGKGQLRGGQRRELAPVSELAERRRARSG